jgi:hypothetical protein
MQGAQNVGSPPPRTECETGLVAEDAFERPAAGTGGARDVVQVAGGVVDDEGGGPDGAILCRPGQPERRLRKLVQLVDQYGHERCIEMLCHIQGAPAHDMEQKLSREAGDLHGPNVRRDGLHGGVEIEGADGNREAVVYCR